jgi:hypothetical protein
MQQFQNAKRKPETVIRLYSEGTETKKTGPRNKYMAKVPMGSMQL